jgi:hypothetical protein
MLFDSNRIYNLKNDETRRSRRNSKNMKGYDAPFSFFVVLVSSRFTTLFLYVRKVLFLLTGIIFVAFLVICYFFIVETNRPMRSIASVMFLVDVA